MGVGAGLYMYDVVVKKVHVCYLTSWWVLVSIPQWLAGNTSSKWPISVSIRGGGVKRELNQSMSAACTHVEWCTDWWSAGGRCCCRSCSSLVADSVSLSSMISHCSLSRQPACRPFIFTSDWLCVSFKTRRYHTR